ncbi:MAG: hypothetical protein L3J59_10370 [Methylococcaceae bacterium]|nr:hypothetical protein [Methylococcaceae bacterium]
MNTKILLKILKLGLGLIFGLVAFIFDAFSSNGDFDNSRKSDMDGMSETDMFSSDIDHL